VSHPSKSVTTVWVVDAWSRITLLSELSEEKDFGLTWKHFEDRTGESEEALLALMAAAHVGRRHSTEEDLKRQWDAYAAKKYIEHKQNENFPVDGEIPNLSIRSRRKPKVGQRPLS
jgi:hypothetical protein